jgi:hypothetical protein
MTTFVTRLYETRDKAASAAAALSAIKFKPSDVDVFSGGDGTVAALRKAGVYPAAAAVYAARIAAGAALVVARAPFGFAKQVVTILDKHAPVPAAVKYTETYADSAPGKVYEKKYLPELVNYPILSDGMLPPALTKKSIIFSSFFGIPTLSDKQGRAELLPDNPTPFSSLFGLKLLSSREPGDNLIRGNTTPFSSLFGLPLLTRNPDRTFLTD